MHGLADQHLAQHRADGGLAVAVARERRASRALEGEVAAATVAVDDFADQQGTAVAELRREVAELVAGVDLGDGRRVLGQGIAGEDCRQCRFLMRGEVEPKFIGEFAIQEQQLRRFHRCRRPGHVTTGQIAGIAVVEIEQGGWHGLWWLAAKLVTKLTAPAAGFGRVETRVEVVVFPLLR